MTEAALDHAAVEELRRVLRAQAERELRVAQRLGAAAVPLERPREGVIAVDRRPRLLADPRPPEGIRKIDAVVCFEERVLDVRAHAARPLEPVDGGDERVLAPCRPSLALASEEVAERADVLRQGHGRRGATLEPDSAAEIALRSGDVRERIESGGIPRPVPEGGLVCLRGRSVVAHREEELAELRLRPGGRLRAGNRALRRELHGGARAGHVTAQLTCVRDARVRGDVRLEPRHRVEGSEGRVVTTELEERVADRSEVPRR